MTPTTSRPFTNITKVLIANRGEIAVRIAHTCSDVGLTSVAIYADPDADALHVRVSDEAYSLEGVSVADTYINIEKILEIAKRCGAELPSDSAASSSARRPSRCMSATTVCRKYGRQSTMCPAISSQMLPSQGSVSEEKTRMKPKASTSGGRATGN